MKSNKMMDVDFETEDLSPPAIDLRTSIVDSDFSFWVSNIDDIRLSLRSKNKISQ